MNIKDYKDKFLALFEQMEIEHGRVKEVRIYHRSILLSEIGNEYETHICEIMFS